MDHNMLEMMMLRIRKEYGTGNMPDDVVPEFIDAIQILNPASPRERDVVAKLLARSNLTAEECGLFVALLIRLALPPGTPIINRVER